MRVGLVGAGYMGRGIAMRMVGQMPGMRLVAIANRTLANAERAYTQAGVESVTVDTVARLEAAAAKGQYAITDNASLLCQADCVDVIIEATGELEFGAGVALEAIENGKHIVVMNAELDATVGPILKVRADRAGVIFTNADGDQPGVIMNLVRFVKATGFQPVLAGNMKGLQDPYRTPETQREFARRNLMSVTMVTSFADGTKVSMEMAVVANATGFRAARRGMYGPRATHVTDALKLFPLEDLLQGGIVDYVLGAEPGPGVFVLGYDNNPIKRQYVQTLKMGDGPFYVFYTPYHLCHLEVPLTAARAVLFHDAAVAPIAGPVCDVITVAKRDLAPNETLDGLGGFTCYGVLENSDVCHADRLLPMGLSPGCRLRRAIAKDQAISIDDVDIPNGRLIDRLRAEQTAHFASATHSGEPDREPFLGVGPATPPLAL